MRLSFSIAIVAVFFVACNQQAVPGLLNAEPFASLTDSIRQSPAEAELYYKRGLLLYQKDQLSYAKEDIVKAWRLQPKEEYGLSLARLLEKKAIDSSILFLQVAARNHPQAVSLQVALARSYVKNGEDAKAIALCDTIVAKFPGQLDALLLKAEILSKNGEQAEATAVLERAYLLAPGDADLAHTLGFHYAENGNPKVLLLADSLQKADLNGTHAEPLLLKGIYYYNQRKFDDAVKAFDAAIVIDYNFMDAHMYKGQVFYDLKKYTEAAKTFALVTSISPTYADGYFWLGKTQEALQDKPGAKLNYERAFGLDKELLEARAAAERLK